MTQQDRRTTRRRRAPAGAVRRGVKNGYHHGSLRRALLDAALGLIEKDGPEGFTLRAAARAAGVTPGAPYHHFEDKQALLAALAEEGFVQLGDALKRAGGDRDDAAARAYEMGVAYVRFAVEHPTQFRLMMSRDMRRAMKHQGLADAARSAYELTRTAVIDDVGSSDPEVVLASWSVVHGLAFLAIDGHLAGAGASWKRCEPLVRRTLQVSTAARSFEQ